MPVFDKFKTGERSPESAVYICTGCGEVIPLSNNERFPPCTECGSGNWMNVASAGEAGKTYAIGKDSEESGLFLCRGCDNQVIPIAKGDNFPPCRTCGSGTKWQLVLSA